MQQIIDVNITTYRCEPNPAISRHKSNQTRWASVHGIVRPLRTQWLSDEPEAPNSAAVASSYLPTTKQKEEKAKNKLHQLTVMHTTDIDWASDTDRQFPEAPTKSCNWIAMVVAIPVPAVATDSEWLKLGLKLE